MIYFYMSIGAFVVAFLLNQLQMFYQPSWLKRLTDVVFYAGVFLELYVMGLIILTLNDFGNMINLILKSI